MNAEVFEVKGRRRASDPGVAGLEAFRLSKGGTIDARGLVKDRQVTLHSLDTERGVAVFVATPSDVRLTDEPFFYVAQLDHAVEVFVVPFAELEQLAAEVTSGPRTRVSLFNTGRCGSTLLKKMFGSVGSCLSLSEPHPYLDLARANLSVDEEVGMLSNATDLYSKPMPAPFASHLVLKYDGRCTGLASSMHQAVPDEIVFFMYRNVYDVVRSNMRLWCRYPQKMWMFDKGTKFPLLRPFLLPVAAAKIEEESLVLPPLIDYSAEDFVRQGAVGILTRKWLATMEQCFEAMEVVPIVAFRFEELVAQPELLLKSIFERCGLSEDLVPQAAQVASQGDSQKGTRNARQFQTGWEWTVRDRLVVEEILAEHPTINDSHYVLPGTLGITA